MQSRMRRAQAHQEAVERSQLLSDQISALLPSKRPRLHALELRERVGVVFPGVFELSPHLTVVYKNHVFGPIVSTALVTAIGNGISFRKRRDLAAWLGLVPRQHSTGGKSRLLGISKLGNECLRRMMLHGARSLVMQIERKHSALGERLTSLSARSHRNITEVALANKMARIAYAILSNGAHYNTPALVAA